jgi:hypothetical protein
MQAVGAKSGAVPRDTRKGGCGLGEKLTPHRSVRREALERKPFQCRLSP